MIVNRCSENLLKKLKNYMRITGSTVQLSRECWKNIKRYIPIFLIILL